MRSRERVERALAAALVAAESSSREVRVEVRRRRLEISTAQGTTEVRGHLRPRRVRQICARLWARGRLRLLQFTAGARVKVWARPRYTTEGVQIYRGDCLDVLKALPNASVEAVVTDPPYGLSKHSPELITAVLKSWLSGERADTSKIRGFMGKSWDSFVPGPEIWREVLRVLKPGGHLLIFAGTRTMDLMGLAVRIAGFELRDSIMVQGILSYCFGSGFPKSTSISKEIDKYLGKRRRVIKRVRVKGGGTEHINRANCRKHEYRSGEYQKGENVLDVTAPASKEAKRFSGWGSALKPAHEPILIFRKSLDGTLAQNTLKHGCGGLNIDACRVGSARHDSRPGRGKGDGNHTKDLPSLSADWGAWESNKGRWPPNAVFCHLPGCRLVGTKKVKGDNRGKPGGKRGGGFVNTGAARGDSKPNAAVYGDGEVEHWICAPGCAVAALDHRSGVSTGAGGSTSGATALGQGSGWNAHENHVTRINRRNDTGGASRFFPCFGGEEPPFFYTAKASRAEKNHGVEGQMGHPTCKPVAIMEYLLKLVVPPGGTVLDPFAGSGTTGVAARRLGISAILIERERQYAKWAQQRVAAALTLKTKPRCGSGGVKKKQKRHGLKPLFES